MHRNLSLITLSLAAALAGGCAMQGGRGGGGDRPEAPARIAEGTWVAPNGYTLYTFDRDNAGSGRSECNGPCAAQWPPFFADRDARERGGWTVISREDGSRQWAFRGRPLYRYAGDTQPGERRGSNANGVWHVARP